MPSSEVFPEANLPRSQAHETHMARLRWLVGEKKKVEVQMQSKIAALEKEYRSHALDLQLSAEQRARQLN